MKQFALIFSLFLCCTCSTTKEAKTVAEQIYYNGIIYTMDDLNPVAEAVAVSGDSIVGVGHKDQMMKFRHDKTKMIDLNGATMVPGLIEGHAHILGIGHGLLNVDLMDTRSYEDVINKVKKRAANTPEGTWVLGRGWHQDKWDFKPEMVSGFPTHDMLSEAVPNHPVYLKHASGHATLVNQKAMDIAAIHAETPRPEGGEIFHDLSGKPTGLLNETAQSLVDEYATQAMSSQADEALRLALEECFKNGITGFHQAGSERKDIELFKKFAEKGDIKLRLYIMLRGTDPDLLNDYFSSGKQINLYNNQLTIRSIKLYSDGALGSRGAWLLAAYSDAPGVYGHKVMLMEDIKKITEQAYRADYQVCVHAIGDRANREVLDIYEHTFQTLSEGEPSDHRFRIEHAQHFHPDDISRFAELGVIPAMQAIHMSSDRPWAIRRLGRRRIDEGAYMWQSLLQSGAKIVNGSDAPVEPINPLASFYASISRRTLKGIPKGGYEPAQKMTREQALRSYTLDAAYGAFQENEKGSIEVGKWADFTILDQDIMTIPEDDILNTNIVATIIGGEIVYDAKSIVR